MKNIWHYAYPAVAGVVVALLSWLLLTHVGMEHHLRGAIEGEAIALVLYYALWHKALPKGN